MNEYFEVKKSNIHGMGLFCKKNVPIHSIFHLSISRPTTFDSTYVKNQYILDYYVPQNIEEADCLINNRVKKTDSIKLHPDVFNKKYVRCSDIMMYANDLAWPAKNQHQYDTNCQKNHMDMVLVFSNDNQRIVTGVACRILKSIQAGEECGNTYGYEYWLND